MFNHYVVIYLVNLDSNWMLDVFLFSYHCTINNTILFPPFAKGLRNAVKFYVVLKFALELFVSFLLSLLLLIGFAKHWGLLFSCLKTYSITFGSQSIFQYFRRLLSN